MPDLNSTRKELSWRVNLLLASACCGIVIVLELRTVMDSWSLHVLAIVAAAIGGLASLLYLPRITLVGVGYAACVWLYYSSLRLRHWQILIPVVAVGFIYTAWAINSTVCDAGKELHSGLREICERLDELQETVNEIREQTESRHI